MFTIELQRETYATNKVPSTLCSGVFMYFLSFYPLDSPCKGRHPPPPHFKMGTLEFQGFPHSQWVSWDSPCCLVSLSVQLSQPHLIFQPYAGHRIHCRTVVKSEFPQRSQPHLSWCSTAISYLLWESSLASPTTLNQALNIFFRRKRTRSFRTSSSTWVRYWGWGREETWDKQYHRQRIRANKQYKRELQQI